MGPTLTKSSQIGDSAAISSTLPCLGAHVNGGLKSSVAKAIEIGAQCIQIFIGSPQTWRPPSPASVEIQSFCQGIKQSGLGPVFVHGNYLVNLASASEDNLRKSVDNLRTALLVSDAIGAEGLIFHPGSAGTAAYDDAIDRVVRSLSLVLEDYDGRCRLLLEVCAGQGQTIGDRFCEFGHILKAMNKDKRLGVCWDTCHLFNAGYDVATKSGLRKTMDEFESEVGFEWLYALHANDSKTPLGARRDRHENIGMGHIGETGFALMMQQPELRSVPWILEVPGAQRKGPDRANLEVLRQLAAAALAGYSYLD
ncbi:MAG TPA: deoxyribonuclease IV [Trichormus sp.]|jgi:deoxyribonuclease-4